jgi:hypothetical protein
MTFIQILLMTIGCPAIGLSIALKVETGRWLPWKRPQRPPLRVRLRAQRSLRRERRPRLYVCQVCGCDRVNGVCRHCGSVDRRPQRPRCLGCAAHGTACLVHGTPSAPLDALRDAYLADPDADTVAYLLAVDAVAKPAKPDPLFSQERMMGLQYGSLVVGCEGCAEAHDGTGYVHRFCDGSCRRHALDMTDFVG